MEKQGMGRGKRSPGPGLLITIALMTLLLAVSRYNGLRADEGGNQDESSGLDSLGPLELRVETSPASPAAGSPWSIFILVNTLPLRR